LRHLSLHIAARRHALGRVKGLQSLAKQSFDCRKGVVRDNCREPVGSAILRCAMTNRSPFRNFRTSPEIICLAAMPYIRFPLLLRKVEDLLHERGIDVSLETVRFRSNRFGPMFADEIRRIRAQSLRSVSRWQWHLDKVFVKVDGGTYDLWRAVDHETCRCYCWVASTWCRMNGSLSATAETGSRSSDSTGRFPHNS
jgi:putative transposase